MAPLTPEVENNQSIGANGIELLLSGKPVVNNPGVPPDTKFVQLNMADVAKQIVRQYHPFFQKINDNYFSALCKVRFGKKSLPKNF